MAAAFQRAEVERVLFRDLALVRAREVLDDPVRPDERVRADELDLHRVDAEYGRGPRLDAAAAWLYFF